MLLVSVIVLLSLFYHAVITSRQDKNEIKIDSYPWCIFILPVHFYIWHSSEWEGGTQLVEALLYRPKGRGFDSRWGHWKSLLTQSFQPHCGPEVDSTSNRNEYQEYFLGGKGSQCIGLTTFMCRLSSNLGASISWNPQGLSRDCFTFAFTLLSGKPGWYCWYIDATGWALWESNPRSKGLLSSLKRLPSLVFYNSSGYSSWGVTLTTHHHKSIEVMNEWSYTSIPPMCLNGMDRDNFTFPPPL